MLTQLLTRVAVVVAILLVLSMAAFVGLKRLVTTRAEFSPRLRRSGPVLLLLGVTLALNRYMRQNDMEVGFHMTGTIRSIEGEFVLIFQEIETWWLTMYFSFSYVYGYTFLLIFPAVAYFALSDTKTFRRLLTAYSLNYAIGVILYILVIAYGPRQVFVGDLDTVLYDFRPEYQHLTRQVNRNTNVFPSLHTSLSTTVAMFAYATRSRYPMWFPVAVGLAISVIISTMYLGIHWGVDVVAGIALAATCVWLSHRLVGRWSLSTMYERVTGSETGTGTERH